MTHDKEPQGVGPNFLHHITSRELDTIKEEEYFEGFNQGVFDTVEFLIARRWVTESGGQVIRDAMMRERRESP